MRLLALLPLLVLLAGCSDSADSMPLVAPADPGQGPWQPVAAERVAEDCGGYDCGPLRYVNAREGWEALLDCERMGVRIRDADDDGIQIGVHALDHAQIALSGALPHVGGDALHKGGDDAGNEANAHVIGHARLAG